MKRYLVFPLLALSLQAQTFETKCKDKPFCEVLDSKAPATGQLLVDAGNNGSITVKGYNGNTLLVRARVESEKKDVINKVVIHTTGTKISATGPSRDWDVAFEIFVPRKIGLELKATNGGIAVSGVSGNMNLRSVNGGLTIADADGSIKGITSNGGITVRFNNTKLDGSGIDLSTDNGGINLKVPAKFSAQLDASTVNGRVDVSLPGASNGNGKELKTTLGAGGPVVKLRTTNGGVTVGQL